MWFDFKSQIDELNEKYLDDIEFSEKAFEVYLNSYSDNRSISDEPMFFEYIILCKNKNGYTRDFKLPNEPDTYLFKILINFSKFKRGKTEYLSEADTLMIEYVFNSFSGEEFKKEFFKFIEKLLSERLYMAVESIIDTYFWNRPYNVEKIDINNYKHRGIPPIWGMLLTFNDNSEVRHLLHKIISTFDFDINTLDINQNGILHYFFINPKLALGSTATSMNVLSFIFSYYNFSNPMNGKNEVELTFFNLLFFYMYNTSYDTSLQILIDNIGKLNLNFSYEQETLLLKTKKASLIEYFLYTTFRCSQADEWVDIIINNYKEKIKLNHIMVSNIFDRTLMENKTTLIRRYMKIYNTVKTSNKNNISKILDSINE